jgi:outer membrane protein assembly factor BamB
MKRGWMTVSLLVATLCWSIGCASGGGGGATSSGADRGDLPISSDAALAAGYSAGWATPVPVTGGQRLHAVRLLDGMIVMTERPTNIVSAVDATNGQLLWTTQVPGDLEVLFAPLRRGDQVLVNTQTRIFTLDAATGELLAAGDLVAPVEAPGVVIGPAVVFGGTNGRVFAHGIDTNFDLWQYQLPEAVVAAPTKVEQDVFVADAGGNYALLQGDTGELIWRNRTYDGTVASAAYEQGDVIVPSRDNALYALNRISGEDAWVYHDAERPLTFSPLARDRYVFQPVRGIGVIGIDAFEGTELWRQQLNGLPITLHDGRLIMAGPERLLFVDPQTGDVQHATDVDTLKTVLATDAGALILVTPRGQLMRLDPLGG